MIGKLFNKNATPNPRFIDVRGHEWGNKSKLEYMRTPDVLPGILFGALLSLHEMSKGRADTAITLLVASTVLSVAGSAFMKTALSLSALNQFAIDRTGRSHPPKHNRILISDAKRTARQSLFYGSLNAGVLCTVLPKAFDTAVPPGAALILVPFFSFAAHNFQRTYTLSQLAKGRYTFCGKPPAKKTAAKSKAAKGALVNGI